MATARWKAIRARGGQYVLARKGNRGPLYHATKALVAEAPWGATQPEPKAAHGRRETRQAAVLPVPESWAARFKFTDLAAVARIDARRQIKQADERQSRYFVLSQSLPAEQVLAVVRAHWGIENRQHWVLDAIFDEDRARTRKDHAGQNLALLRRLALNLLQTDTFNASIRRKVKRAGWDETYFFSLLSHMR